MIPPIYIGLVLLDALLLWALIGARGKWPLKVAAMVAVLSFNFFVLQSLNSFEGWPTTQAPPVRAVFVQGIVDEPDQQSNDPGAIYLWLVPLTKPGNPLGYQSKSQEPRAYRQPYSESLYQQVVKAQQLQAKGHGQPVVVRSMSGRPHGRTHNSNGQKFSMHAYLLPASHPPRKTGETP